jgi:hypothetical protein
VTSISLLALLGALTATPAPPVPTIPPATPAPVPPASPLASETPIASPTPVASPSPTAVPTLSPASYGYRFVPQQPANPKPGTPQIYAVYLNAQHLRSHGPILIRVETNDSVVKMQSKSNGRGGSIPMVAPGVFFAQSMLPGIPFIARGISTDLVFTATSADGQTVSVHVPVVLG